MSVFADSQWSAFDSNPFGWDSVHNSSPFRGFGFGSGLGLFEDDREKKSYDEQSSSKMKFRSAESTLAERGFYDHFDSVFHDLSHGSRRCNDYGSVAGDRETSRRQSPQTGKGKEYVIPIKIERSPSLSSSVSTPDSAYASRRSSSASSKGAIEIPIIRETSNQRESSGAAGQRTNFSIPRHFKLLTPTTEAETRSFPKRASHADDADIFLDSDDFFREATKPSRYPDNIEIIEVKEEEETRTSHRRKLQRHPDDVSSTSSKSSTSSRTENSATSPSKNPASSANIRHADNVTIIDVRNLESRRESEREKPTAASAIRQKVPCSSAGIGDVTPTPSYPIYDLLKPRLARIDRQLDYIRGDGNCFFRALSKEMYGSEDYHAEWRQAVVDVVESHPHVFRQYIDGENVGRHVRDMRRAGAWATTCEIYAAATLLQREIYVLAPSPAGQEEYNWLLFSPRPLPGAPSGSGPGPSASASSSSSTTAAAAYQSQAAVPDVHPCYLTLCYTNGNHYDRITPVFAQCNCDVPPPNLNGVSVLVDLSEEEEGEGEEEDEGKEDRKRRQRR